MNMQRYDIQIYNVKWTASYLLILTSFLNFPGTIKNGLRCAPSGDKAYYPLGSSITVRHIATGGGQEFLTGHTHPIGCLAMSNSGKYLARDIYL